MIISLKNKRALVTGGGTGIGQYIVKALAESVQKLHLLLEIRVILKDTLKLLKK